MCIDVFFSRTCVVIYILSSLAILRVQVPIYLIANMDGFPSNSQCPQSFHPDFEWEVYMVVFSVGAIIDSL